MSEELLRLIIGDIASNTNYGSVMKKWRNIFKIKQGLIADALGIKQSVISDYEKQRVKNPGIAFVRDYSLAVIKIAKEKNYSTYSKVLKSFRIEKQNDYLTLSKFSKEYSPMELVKKFGANQIIMPNSEFKVNNFIFFNEKISKVLTNSPSYKILNHFKSQNTLFVFLNVKTGNFPLIAINMLSGINKEKSPSIFLFQGKSFKISWIARKLAKSNNISVLATKKESEELLSTLKKM